MEAGPGLEASNMPRGHLAALVLSLTRREQAFCVEAEATAFILTAPTGLAILEGAEIMEAIVKMAVPAARASSLFAS